MLVWLIAYLAIEFTPLLSPANTDSPDLDKSLHQAAEQFYDLTLQFERDAEELANMISEALRLDVEKEALFNRFQQTGLWGVVLLKNGELHVWDGYDLTAAALNGNLSANQEITTRIITDRNTVILLADRSFVHDENEFQLLLGKRLSQTSELPFFRASSYSLADELTVETNESLEFSFTETPPDNRPNAVLQTQFSDSAGFVYASETQEISDPTSPRVFFRYLLGFAAFFIIVLRILLFGHSRKQFQVPLTLLVVILAAWAGLKNSSIIQQFAILAEGYAATTSEVLLPYFTYAVDTFFLLLLWVSFLSLTKLTQKAEWNDQYFRTILLSSIYGLLQLVLILYFFESTQALLLQSDIPLLDLELAPDTSSFFFFILSALFFAGISGLAISTGYYIHLIEEGKSLLVNLIAGTAFILFYFILISVPLLPDLQANSALFGFTLLLVYLFISTSIYHHPGYFKRMSGFRKVMLIVLAASISIYAIMWSSVRDRLDNMLAIEAAEFTKAETVNTPVVLTDLLSNLENNFPEFEDDSLLLNTAPAISQLRQVIQQTIRTEWLEYGIYVRIISPDNREIATYSTTLETPAWSDFYDTDLMLRTYRGERIRRATNRPVVWNNMPANISDRFISLSRGWIPVYSEGLNNGNIVAWIAADVYLERPDYQKPFRALLYLRGETSWENSLYLAEYTGRRLTRNSIFGLYQQQPQYYRLPERELEIARDDSLTYLTKNTEEGSFRELIVNLGERRFIKASTPYPGINQHLFSFFRFHLVLIIFGLFCFACLSIIGFSGFSLFGQNRRFHHRLIDALTLATLLFLIVLIFATRYSMDIQNEKNLQRELVQRLNNMAESVDLFSESGTNPLSNSMLSRISAPFDIDLILYDRYRVEESSTPQLFRQNHIPSLIPFTAHINIYERQRSHYVMSQTFAGEELLIGYQTVLDATGEPIGVLAIPTFLESPVYKEQILETTSYLFVVYLFIFILFIGGTVFLSGQLTRSLSRIQEGLKRISGGNMKTRVPVTSQDEIGSLASAYNSMLERLEEAQQELLKAERESAWKEMAQQVAHEIKNPLTPMKLNLQQLQRQLERNPEDVMKLRPLIERTADNIIEQIESLNKIASDFSKFARPVSEPKKELNLVPIARSVFELYSRDEKIEIDFESDSDQIQILGVEDEIRRVLVNLVKNAIEASEDDTASVSIQVGSSNPKTALIRVADRGKGIDPDNRDRIFVPNFSTKSSGTGLGLAISKKIVEAHDGEIWFEDGEKSGTVFFIRMPKS